MRHRASTAQQKEVAQNALVGTKLDSGEFEFEAGYPYVHHKLDEELDAKVRIDGDALLKLYYDMFECRRVETAADTLYKQRHILGFLHLNLGQEAVAYGVEAGMRADDHLITAYRDHGQFLARGGSIKAALAELLGKQAGCSRGKGGSMHFYDFARNFYGGNGIVGAQVPIGAGIALAQKHLKTDAVAYALYGDGAANQGQVAEAMNMAKLWDLPVVFVCENNHYGMGTSAVRSSASRDFYARGDYVPGLRADGMDVLAVKKATEFCAEHCRSGRGPIVLELDSYRYVGHSMSDPGISYRTREEVAEVRKLRDPLEMTKRRLVDNGICELADIKAEEKVIRKKVDAAMKWALDQPFPALDETYRHISINHNFPVRGRHLGEIIESIPDEE